MLARAEELLVALLVTDIFSWPQVMTSSAQNGHGRDAINCFEGMLHKEVFLNAVTLTAS